MLQKINDLIERLGRRRQLLGHRRNPPCESKGSSVIQPSSDLSRGNSPDCPGRRRGTLVRTAGHAVGCTRVGSKEPGPSGQKSGHQLLGRAHMKRYTKFLALAALGAVVAGTASADTSGKKIAFSNNYAGNSWRQAMLNSYALVTKKAVADGIVAAADVFTTADKEVPTQAAQIQNLILQGYDAIVINASSPDALNGAIKQACDAGIIVVSFDGIVTEPCAWRVVVDFKDMGKQEVEQMAKFQPKGGNLLEIRGLAGTSIDEAIHNGI